jgi:hypothetical protein
VGVKLTSKTRESGVTRLLALKLTGIRPGDTVQVLCRNGCRARIGSKTRVSSTRARLDLTHRVRNRRLRPGVRIGRRDRAASVVTFTTRRLPGQRPPREPRCQWPQEHTLRPC